ncbi:MAG TPA: efflux RND transporter periplasmic adaptor subunit, partial [Pseudomonadales bacterium]|nr:efflux RND transporter periplasmic adaptor subunit [Pseudomonadales bacterium]
TRTKLDLSYADVRAPISGHIGRALVTEGALVGKDSPTHLATIEQIDTVYIDFYESGPELLRVRKKFNFGAKGGVENPNISIVLPDKSLYPLKGKLLFSEQSTDPATESVLLRAEVPNPDHLMLPGMVVLVSVEQGAMDQAITVPQRAVMRNQLGASVMVLGQDGIVQPVPIETDFAYGDRWVVSKGLKGGEQVIVEGLQKVHPGAPAHAAAATASPAPAAH